MLPIKPKKIVLLELELIKIQGELIKLLETKIIELRLPNKPSTIFQVIQRQKLSAQLSKVRSRLKSLQKAINLNLK